MIPPTPQHLTSHTISRCRRSFHWSFGEKELDVNIEPDQITIFFFGPENNRGSWSFPCSRHTYQILREWLVHIVSTGNAQKWFGGIGVLENFIINEHQELTNEIQLGLL